MDSPPNIVAISACMQRLSRTHSLVTTLLSSIACCLPVQIQVVELGEIGPYIAGLDADDALPAPVASAVTAIESADLLVIASPVVHSCYVSLLKHLFEFVHRDALEDMPVLLADCGGEGRTGLIVDRALGPQLDFFRVRRLPLGVHANDSEFERYDIAATSLRERVALAARSVACHFASGSGADRRGLHAIRSGQATPPGLH